MEEIGVGREGKNLAKMKKMANAGFFGVPLIQRGNLQWVEGPFVA